MSSRTLPPRSSGRSKNSALALAIAVVISCFFLLAVLIAVFLFLYRRFWRRTSAQAPPPPVPDMGKQLRRFSYRELRSATSRCDPSRLLGRGASAAVFGGVLPDGKPVAVKKLAAHSPITAERELQNELHVLGSAPASPFVVSLLGYSLDGGGRQMLVYEYVAGGTLQEALFGNGDGMQPPPLGWERRFQIILDVAQAISFLHVECDPAIVHGDIKPSNVLLTSEFRAKVSDFGLARIKDEGSNTAPEFLSQELGFSQELWRSQELDGQGPSHPTVDFALAIRASSSFRCSKVNPIEKNKQLFDDDEPPHTPSPSALGEGTQWGKEWWWKQDGSRELCSKDYIQEWIGSQISHSDNLERQKLDPLYNSGPLNEPHFVELGVDTHISMPDPKGVGRSIDCLRKSKRGREWWKEEYFAEISKKGKCNKGLNWLSSGGSVSTHIDFAKAWRKKKSRSIGNEMWSSELFSKEFSSTTSMRGTVCYIAPEYGGYGHLTEKADIYSFGVLILVIVSGRRPLHVLSSPMRLEKANLISWCRQLAHSGDVLELVDQRVDSFNKEQAALCINLALLCLQRTPELRPDGGDIVKILRGEMDLPIVPFESSPSPRSRLLSKSRRRNTPDAE